MKTKSFLFEETQNFRQWGLWAVLLVSLLPVTGILIYQLSTGQQVGDKPAPNVVLLFLTILIVLPLLLGFYVAKLTTSINNEGIYFDWNIPGSTLNFIKWEAIQKCELIRYSFVGLGYRLSTRYGTVYNVKGSAGVHIIKRNGEEILIGTARPEELKGVIEGLKNEIAEDQGN